MKMVIVDDSIVQLKRLDKLLTEMGHEITGQGSNGTEAVKLFEEQQPDILFMDIVMPEIDGFEALRTIKARHPQARVVLVTSTAGVGGQVELAYRLGAVDVISKPFSQDDIQRAIQRLGNGEPHS